ncbi:MAG TPA: PEP/pyruvate-binding domain-containing protein [Candidatus Limnocylindrales bacterium]|nr:PEP/pyruvate-binding domain-containing protein [Candidatus Limnocylindrales bacterium]
MSRPDDPFIAWLDAGARPDVADVGGKGASLARLAGLGFRVPPGFAVTTAAFRAQVAAVGRGAIGTATLHPDVAEALARGIDQLARELAGAGFEPRFAVRSSAIAEDGAAASYAGLHETELDVAPDGIDGAVRRCWASLWSPVAAAYRARREIDPADAAMAVVVQALVRADASAVVFTRHPVTGRQDQLVLTSTRGLGDAMVSGAITPDTTVVDKATGRVLEFDAGEDSSGAGSGGGPALAPGVLAELVALSLEVEARFGLPVDIEAAHAGGCWYLLQARPITTGAGVGAA